MSDQFTILNFIEKLKQSIDKNEFVKLTLSKPVGQEIEIQNVYIRIIEIKSIAKLSFTYRYKKKDIVSNYSIDEGIQQIDSLMGQQFLNADLYTTQFDLQLRFSTNKNVKLFSKNPTHKSPVSTDHDKQKKRMIQTKDNTYLQALGIVDQRGELNKSMTDKYRQINKYIEIIDSLLKNIKLPDEIKVVDMGSGKGYLTFALYDYLLNILHKKTVMTGIEQEENLVNICNHVAEKSGFNDLDFKQTRIFDYKDNDIDILIALHACDTATDEAIFKGIQLHSKLIIVAPCCHKQIRQQMKCQTDLKPILSYGILEERQAEIITDGIRALLLEANGYKTNVFEFISLEHTGKNIMITAIKSDTPKDKTALLTQIEKIKTQFGIQYHHLEKLL